MARATLLRGWGRTAPTSAELRLPLHPADATAMVAAGPARGSLARGLGRSYGDAAQNAGGSVLATTAMTGVLGLDSQRGVARVAAGTSLDQLIEWLVPRGWFVPVTPGTRQVTVGGAVACDIHGKDHHRDGSWCEHVAAITLGLADGSIVSVGPEAEHPADRDLFWATAGGMGLTGVVLDATIRLRPITTSRLLVDTTRSADLDEALAGLAAADAVHPYSVAWIDILSRGRALGRSVITAGRFAHVDELAELDPVARTEPLAYGSTLAVPAPPVPRGLLNRATVRAFNELWFRKAPACRRAEIQSIGTFFHPLDGVRDWNRLYGPRGFVQWQVVVPFGEEQLLRSLIEALAASAASPFLAVLKRFGPGNDGPLSFPIPGWTLAVDLPTTGPDLGPLLDRLDERVAAAGGRVYLAKDARLRPELLPVMYPRLTEWRTVRERVDPGRRLQSDLGRRLGLA